jgi:ribosomal protein S18 acetylase RimI-like enzyme
MDFTFRDMPKRSDAEAVRHMAERTGFFRPDEVDVAVELVEERLAKGEASGYYFWFADREGVPVGYVCFGPIPCAVGSYDLYWIVVDKDSQGGGLGLRLTGLAEETARNMGGRRLYVETAGKEQYRGTRAFYERAGYFKAAELPDFYDAGDAKIIYQKNLQ